MWPSGGGGVVVAAAALGSSTRSERSSGYWRCSRGRPRLFDPVGHETMYSKVPIKRTGPIIRTVLIFFRYFTIISTARSQKM